MVVEDSVNANERAFRPTRFIDALGRVRALLHSRSGIPVIAFYDEKNAQGEVAHGLQPVLAILFRMLGDPEFHPEIVAGPPADGLEEPPKEVDEPRMAEPPDHEPVPHRAPADTRPGATQAGSVGFGPNCLGRCP